MNISPVRRKQSLVEEVYEQLARQIRAELNSGDGWLPAERELSRQLAVSRNVMREATKRLESQGLIEIQHGVGIRVVDNLQKPLNSSLALLIPDPKERLRQLTEARRLIEPEIARLAAMRATAAQVRDLREAHARLVAAENVEQAVAADLEFHRKLARVAGNEICALLLESLAELGHESRKTTISGAGKHPAIEHHARILAAIERREPQEAFEAMKSHLEAVPKDLAKGLRRVKGSRR